MTELEIIAELEAIGHMAGGAPAELIVNNPSGVNKLAVVLWQYGDGRPDQAEGDTIGEAIGAAQQKAQAAQ
jgi:hypothetical protein